MDLNKHRAYIEEPIIEADLSTIFQEIATDTLTTAHRFSTLSNVPLHCGLGFFDSSLVSRHQVFNDIDCEASAGDYDVFEDDVLWKEIARKDFYIPWDGNPSSQVDEGRLTRKVVSSLEARGRAGLLLSHKRW